MSAVPSLSHGATSIVLHQIDVAGSTCIESAVSLSSADLQSYLAELLTEINARPQSREFGLASSTTQFAVALAKFSSGRSLTSSGAANGNAQDLAERLLRIETATEDRFGHLGKDSGGLLSKGSFLQFLFQDSAGLHYLGVKVEHQGFIDELDFKRHIGLGVSNKIYKACRVSFDDGGRPSSIRVFDTNSRIAVYWWHDFLELEESRSNAHNTRTAVEEVVRALGSLKKTSPSDYTVLRNATVAAFKREGTMKFDEFVRDVFSSYDADDEDAKAELIKVVDKIKALPTTKNFDSQFELDPKSVPFRRVRLPLNKDITVSYDEAITNIGEKIWRSRTSTGKTVVVIQADEEAAKNFAFKPMG